LVGCADDNGTPTAGYGHTGGVVIGAAYTEEQCDDWFSEDSSWVTGCINTNVKVDLTQGQFDALFSFIYNVGSGAFEKSTLLKKLNKGDYASVPSEMLKWVISGGVKDAGLVNRRNSEGGQWVQGAYVRGSKIDIETPPPWHSNPVVRKLGGAIVAGASSVSLESVKGAADAAKEASSMWHGFGIVAMLLTGVFVFWALFDHHKANS